MGGTCGTHERAEKFKPGNVKRREPWRLGLILMFKWILKKQIIRMWIGLMWLRIRISGGLS
jgi:hypothetical protein